MVFGGSLVITAANHKVDPAFCELFIGGQR